VRVVPLAQQGYELPLVVRLEVPLHLGLEPEAPQRAQPPGADQALITSLSCFEMEGPLLGRGFETPSVADRLPPFPEPPVVVGFLTFTVRVREGAIVNLSGELVRGEIRLLKACRKKVQRAGEVTAMGTAL
jgi:hypothetical protein